jgi:hypothetical protein
MDRKVRVTLVVSETLDKDIEVFSAITGRKKTEIVTAALSNYLSEQNYSEQLHQFQGIKRGSRPTGFIAK